MKYTREYLKNFILNNCIIQRGLNFYSTRRIWWKVRNIEDHYNEIIEYMTPIIGENKKIRQYFHGIVNDIYEIDKCFNCDNKVTFKSYKEGYTNFCSRKCHAKHPDRIAKIRIRTQKHLDSIELIKKRNLENYGVEYLYRLPEYQEKCRKAKIKKYGSLNPQSAIDKAKKTNLERYGYECARRNQKVIQKGLNTKLERYGTLSFNDPNKTSSGAEKDLLDFVNSFGYTFKKARTLLPSGKEIDMYCEDLGIAIEYCGLYWHCELHRDNNHHYEKWQQCKDKGIQLLTIFEDEWLYNREKVKSFIKSKIGVFDRRIYARNCNIGNVSKEIAYWFFENNHIQGKPNGISEAFGLFFNNELLGVVSYGKHHRDATQCVINRLAFLDNVQVIGGASKLIKNSLKKYNSRVITWSDNRWSTGEIYSKAGFIKNKNLRPDYSYYKNNNKLRIPKQKMKKSNTGCPKEKTEHEWALENKYYRIYDCGKIQWVYEPKKENNINVSY